jgi:hypothetical protein
VRVHIHEQSVCIKAECIKLGQIRSWFEILTGSVGDECACMCVCVCVCVVGGGGKRHHIKMRTLQLNARDNVQRVKQLVSQANRIILTRVRAEH